ncbi:MAG TPA: hypothetical protein VFB78_09445 [Acidimicrobiales bacterium]|nr:hypothetical protein [Acidimicrobiales bacterium]
MKGIRTATCGASEARARLKVAEAYLEAASLVRDEPLRDAFASVATGVAVLAGIAASDSVCCARLGRRSRADDHREAAALLQQATPDGKALAVALLRLLDLKDAAHYGVAFVAPRRAHDAARWAAKLVDRAREEVER